MKLLAKLLTFLLPIVVGLWLVWAGVDDFRLPKPWRLFTPHAQGAASPVATTPASSPTTPPQTGKPEKPSSGSPEPEGSPGGTAAAVGATTSARPTSSAVAQGTKSRRASAPAQFTAIAEPSTLTNGGEIMTVSVRISGGTPNGKVDVEIAGKYKGQSGVCTKFSDAGCSLLVGGDIVDLNSQGSGRASEDIAPCAMFDESTWSKYSAAGSYAVTLRDRSTKKIIKAPFVVRNASDLPPISQWQGGTCS